MKKGKNYDKGILKRIVAVVLLITVVTGAMPLQNWGKIIVQAQMEPVKPNEGTEVATAMEFQEAIQLLEGGDVCIKLTNHMDLTDLEINVPAGGNLWIDTNGFDIYAMESLKFMNEDNSCYVHIDGISSDGLSCGYIMAYEAITLNANMHWVVKNTSVDTNMHYVLEAGAKLDINGRDYSDKKHVFTEYGTVFYQKDEAGVEAVVTEADTTYVLSYSQNGNDTASCTVDYMFWLGMMQYGYTKITIEEGVFSKTVTSEDLGTLTVNEIQLYGNMDEMQTGDTIEVLIEKSPDWDVVIYNESYYSVSAGEETPVWVPWGNVYDDINYDSVFYQVSYSSDEDVKIVNDVTYIKAGAKVIITPDEGYTIYNIYGGSLKPDSSCIAYQPDGSRIITVPSYSLELGINISTANMETETIVADGASELYQLSREPDYVKKVMGASTMDWYGADFVINGKETITQTETLGESYNLLEEQIRVYEICQVGDAEWAVDGVLVSEEGNPVTIECIVIDKSMVRYSYDNYDYETGTPPDGVYDEVIEYTVDTYGMETKLQYTYSMDKVPVEITKVIVTDGEGKVTELVGEKIEGTDAFETQVLWSKTPPLMISVDTQDTENGTGVAEMEGYLFQIDDNASWSSLNAADCYEEGTYRYQIYVRDEYGKLKGELPTNYWIVELGIDLTAPAIQYTDALHTQSSSLQGDNTYEGNLYFTIEETGSGLDSIVLYEQKDGQWEKSDALVEVENEYYITPTNVDKVYKIEVTDKAGNINTYTNVTVKGYVQDVEIAVGDAEGTYGEDLNVAVMIKNTSEYPLKVKALAFREEATDDVFNTQIDIAQEIAPGESVETIVSIPAGADVATYLATLDMIYEVQGDKYHTVTKVCSKSISAVISKAQGSAAVTIKDYYCGENAQYTIHSDTNDIKTVDISYRLADDNNAEYTKLQPTEAGNYIIRVIFEENNNYFPVTVEERFVVSRLIATTDMYTVSATEGSDGWYTSEVRIAATDGNKLSTTENGIYENSLVITESVKNYTFVIKTESGAITAPITVAEIKIDMSDPEVGEKEGIYLLDTWWRTFLKNITFGMYQTERETVLIKAHDDESGIKQISYYVSEKALTQEEVKAIADWTKGAEFTIDVTEAKQYVVYAKIENGAGLVSYISTEGITVQTPEIDDSEPDDSESEEPGDVPEPDDSETENPEEIPDTEEPTIIQIEGSVHLEEGVPYQLGDGNWKVEGDDSIYMGGITFYIIESGDYEFTKN